MDFINGLEVFKINSIQKCILNIYKEITNICKNNNLRFFAIGGSCLGAIRHKGFIPWDDDMDIAMPIEDYLEFNEIIRSELPRYLKVMDPADTKHDYLPYLKIMDARTTMTEATFLKWPDTYEGVWIDVMPLGGVPTKKVSRIKYVWNLRICNWLDYRSKTSFSMQKGFVRKLAWLGVQAFKITLPRNTFWRLWMKRVCKYPFDSSKYTGYVWSKRLKNLIFLSEWFSDYLEVPFENTVIRIPVGWKEMLTQMFGDFMKLPPKEMREKHLTSDSGIVDLSKPFEFYQRKNFKDFN